MWADLTLPWQACLEQAWIAYCSGTIPIGAVVTDADGMDLFRSGELSQMASAGITAAVMFDRLSNMNH